MPAGRHFPERPAKGRAHSIPVHLGYDKPPPAPYLTSDSLCSACRVASMSTEVGTVCPVCFALLWHEDNSELERQRHRERMLAQVAARRERHEERKRMRKALAEEAYQRVQQRQINKQTDS